MLYPDVNHVLQLLAYWQHDEVWLGWLSCPCTRRGFKNHIPSMTEVHFFVWGDTAQLDESEFERPEDGYL
jgi:hypothetical protein